MRSVRLRIGSFRTFKMAFAKCSHPRRNRRSGTGSCCVRRAAKYRTAAAKGDGEH